MISRLHLVDGTYELFRAHFSKRPGHTVAGRDLKATVGLSGSLLALLHDPAEAVTHLAVAFDNPIRSVRNDWFADYKSDDGVPPELRAQFDSAEEAVRALGAVVWSMDRYEADDALGTAATRFAPDVEQVRVMTPDKDLGQIVRGDRVVLVDRMRQRVVDEQSLWQARGIRPLSVPDWLALVGDTADGYPGIAGFGEKTASLLLAAFGTLEQIPPDPKRWPRGIRRSEVLAETLERQRPNALLYRKLATLVLDVPLAEQLSDLAWSGVPRGAFANWCKALEVSTLQGRPQRWRDEAFAAGGGEDPA